MKVGDRVQYIRLEHAVALGLPMDAVGIVISVFELAAIGVRADVQFDGTPVHKGIRIAELKLVA